MHEHAPRVQQDDLESPGAVRSVAAQGGSRPTLVWYRRGIGHLSIDDPVAPYDDAYFQRYVEQSATPMGAALNAARVDMVARHLREGVVLDVGIGSGAFIEARDKTTLGLTLGYDINPRGIEWLRKRRLFLDPWQTKTWAATFWDSLEHIEHFSVLLGNVRGLAFLSLPIFRDEAHARASKHFRPDEHCWYFTSNGLIRVMSELGFDCIENSDVETQLGREDIGSFVFRRRHPPSL